MLGMDRFTILERHEVGASFQRWPSETRLITPSFPSHGFGILDLNAVVDATSPGHMFDTEHLSGPEFAGYLSKVVEHFELPVAVGEEVFSVRPLPDAGGFALSTTSGTITSRFVIWAAGDFQYPNLTPFPGADLCLHSSRISSWASLDGDDFIIVGGYESGIDAAVSLVANGKRVKVVDPGNPWDVDDFDPSVALSPYTYQRLQQALASDRLRLVGDSAIALVERSGDHYLAHSIDREVWSSPVPPILATGFTGSISQISDLFAWTEGGYPLLTDEDESTIAPGLFLSGPMVRHGNLILCFIYKFRQRFAVIANAIGTRMGIDTGPLATLRAHAMYLDDLSCCDDTCIC